MPMPMVVKKISSPATAETTLLHLPSTQQLMFSRKNLPLYHES